MQIGKIKPFISSSYTEEEKEQIILLLIELANIILDMKEEV